MVGALSPSTAIRDAAVKLDDHLRISTITHYLIIDPDRTVVLQLQRPSSKIDTETLRQGLLRLDPTPIDVEVKNFFGKS